MSASSLSFLSVRGIGGSSEVHRKGANGAEWMASRFVGFARFEILKSEH
jgi:hypothetical protein